ncbi:unnamed protein product, partial [Effrenium voratum]
EAEHAMQGIGNCDDRSAYLQLCADLENSTEGGNTALALVEPRHPLWQLRMMSIRTILGVGPDAGVEEIASAARRLYAIYHPDKGGSHSAVTRVPHRFSAPSGQAPKPRVNTAFVTDLLDMADTWRIRVGEMSLGFYLERGLASNKAVPEEYYECELANRLQVPMRLTGRGQRWPLYSYPRLARYAFFTGTGLAELDFPASHGQQFLKYARRHNLSHRTLELAFGSTEAIYEFRRTACPGLPATAVKSACNLLAYGNGLADWRKAHRMAGIPPALQALKDELTTTRTHMASRAPQSWKDAVRDRKHPELTLGSLMCQKGERADLDALGRMIPDVTIHGWLGDSILVSPLSRLAHVCAQARAAGIYVTLKTFPADLEGYLDVIRGFGVHHDGTPMTARQRRRNAARDYARRWLDLKEDEGREGPMPPMPHLDFAVCVEGELPCQYNYASKELEFFNANAGVWMHTGGQAYCRGELLKDALCKVLCTPRWGLDKDGKTRLLPGDDPLFHTAPVLSSVGGMLDKVTPDLSLPDLDDSGNPLMRRLVNFKGPYCLEFSDPPHVTAASTDEELLNALAMCVRTTTTSDRTSRLVPRSFEEYRHPERLELARAVLEAMQARLETCSHNHPAFRKIIYETHNDWDAAIFQYRLVGEPVVGRGPFTEFASYLDDGQGSTGKGALRELCEECLGPFNGGSQRGYVAVMTQEALVVQKTEKPREQLANLEGCKLAFVDDFKPTQDLSGAVLRQISGGNNLTAARKFKGENVFKFHGMLMICANGLWRSDEEWKGADRRRLTGLPFQVEFVDQPHGPNQSKKDSSVKENIKSYFPDACAVALRQAEALAIRLQVEPSKARELLRTSVNVYKLDGAVMTLCGR